MKKRFVILSIAVRAFVCVFLITAGALIMKRLADTRPEAESVDPSATSRRVLVMRAEPLEIGRSWDGYGVVESMSSADVPARVAATVTAIPDGIDAGRQVEAGTVLARLDSSDFERQVEISTQRIADLDAQLARLEFEKTSWGRRLELAEEAAVLARVEYERVEEIVERSAGKQRELDQARQALIQALREEVVTREEADKLGPRESSLRSQRLAEESSRRLAEINVERCRITSPIGGVIQVIDLDTGESVAPGERVARIVSLERVEVALRLPASARREVRTGDEVELRSAGTTPQRWSAIVSRIAPEDDEATRTTSVYVEHRQAPDADDLLPPGRFVRGVVRSSRTALRSVVPRRAVQDGRLWTVVDGALVSRPAPIDFTIDARYERFGLRDSEWVVLEDELPEGALVVVAASRTLVDGMRVTAVMAGEEGEATVLRGSGADHAASSGRVP